MIDQARPDYNNWPKVLVNDDGIRPAGKPDECFYCFQKVGSEHGRDCVCVQKLVRYRVFLVDGVDGDEVGWYERRDPHSWDSDSCEFHKNESSWCSNNAIDDITWDAGEAPEKVKEILKGDGCVCSCIGFTFDSVVDEGPLIDLRKGP